MSQPVGDGSHPGAGDEVSSYSIGSYDDPFDNVPPPPEPPVENTPPEGYSFSQNSDNGSSSNGSGTRDWERDRGRGARTSAVAGVTFERTPPHNIEAEQNMLGTILLNSEAVADVYERLTPEDFYRPVRQTIYLTILHFYGESSETDPILLVGRLDRTGDLEYIGGLLCLHTLASLVPTTTSAQFYVRIVARKVTIRRLIGADTEIAQIGYAGAEDAEPEQLVNEIQQLVFSAGCENMKNDYIPIANVPDDTLEELDLITQNGGLTQDVPTRATNLDKLTDGFHPSQMVIVTARLGVDKSMLTMDFTRPTSIRSGITSTVFLLEMSRNEIMMRIVSAKAKINMASLCSGNLDKWDWTKLIEVGDKIRDAPLFIDDSPNLAIVEIRAEARQLKQKRGLKIIVVDYLQLMSSGKGVESRQQEILEFSRQLKSLAKKLKVPLTAISQLNRGSEARADKKPQVSDLRESGSLEQDAGIVMLIYRPDSQGVDHGRAGGADIIVVKHRGGPAGSITVVHQLHYSRFASLVEEPSGSPQVPGLTAQNQHNPGDQVGWVTVSGASFHALMVSGVLRVTRGHRETGKYHVTSCRSRGSGD